MATYIAVKKSEGYLGSESMLAESYKYTPQIERLRVPVDEMISLTSYVPSWLFVENAFQISETPASET
jgi:hypothetical protein